MAFDGSTLAAATTATLDVNGIFSDTCTVGGSDVDMVKISLVAGQQYEIDVDGGGDFLLRIFDELGNEVFRNDDGNFAADDVVSATSPYGEFKPNYTGSYYVAISPHYLKDYDPFTTIGRFNPQNPLPSANATLFIRQLAVPFWPSAGTVNITLESNDDDTDVLGDGAPQRVEYAGVLDTSGDVDMGRFGLAKGDVIVVDVTGGTAALPFGTVLRVFLSNGIQIGFDDDTLTSEDAEFIFVAPSAADYFIGISGEGNSVYNPLNGTGTIAGPTGSFTVVLHFNPTQTGGTSNQAITGDDGEDYIVGMSGNDTLTGNDGNDTLAGGDDNDSLDGGRGRDVLYGEAQDDHLTGGAGQDVLVGGSGQDMLFGGDLADLMEGGTDDDTLSGGGGNDTARGGDGVDLVQGAAGTDDLFGDAGNDSLVGGAAGDRLFGGTSDDTLSGGAGDDTMDGGSGIDSLLGGAGNDSMTGGDGTDTLAGSVGDDRMDGGLGDDLLTGGAGLDQFVFVNTASGVDTVGDFLLGTDRIDLSAIFAATGSVVTSGNLGFFIQLAAFGDGSETSLAVDADGSTGGLSYTIIAVVNDVTTVQLFDIGNFIV